MFESSFAGVAPQVRTVMERMLEETVYEVARCADPGAVVREGELRNAAALVRSVFVMLGSIGRGAQQPRRPGTSGSDLPETSNETGTPG